MDTKLHRTITLPLSQLLVPSSLQLMQLSPLLFKQGGTKSNFPKCPQCLFKRSKTKPKTIQTLNTSGICLFYPAREANLCCGQESI